LITLGVIIVTISEKNGETKITARDDQSFKVETPEVTVEHTPSSGNPASANRPNTPKTPPAGIPAASPTVKPLPAMTNSIAIKFVLIPAGEFLMGSASDGAEAKAQEKPQHRVRITRPFYLGATEVTIGHFRSVMECSDYHTDAEGEGGLVWNEFSSRWIPDRNRTSRSPGFDQTHDNPVVQVSWADAVAFCNTLSERERIKPYYQLDGATESSGGGYRLPTEAEWEYACRAGSTTRYSFRDDPAKLREYAWFNLNSSNQTHPVGQKRANSFGLYDTHGNVDEWCADSLGDYRLWWLEESHWLVRSRTGGGWVRRAKGCRQDPRWSASHGALAGSRPWLWA
jgi:formylglycine-generating enzyme required for sulfatase activity